ncbi:DUF3883 domain-containing protein [Tardisphaera saccharovorans]
MITPLQAKPGKVLGHARFMTADTAYSVLGQEEYDPGLQKKKREVELAAMNCAMKYEQRKGYEVRDVHEEDLGYDLVSKKGSEEKLIEVKGISEGDEVELTPNEWKASRFFKDKFLLYAVKDPLGQPRLVIERPPLALDHYEYVTHYVVRVD